LPARAEGADDVERDPLRRNSRWRLATGASALTDHHLRLLRLALLAPQEHRANLFEESRIASTRERWSARGREPFDWLLQRAPDDADVRRLLEAAATLARA
jgi:hypothetical protein